jgi:Dual specificity phosphatase, catalytic domain
MLWLPDNRYNPLILIEQHSDRRPIADCYWVVPRRLLAGEYPVGADYGDARARLARFREAGVNYFIDLTEPGEMPAYRHLLPVHAKYTNSPIADSSVPQEVAQMQGLIEEIRAAIEARRCIYLHCRAGIGRTGLVAGCYLADEGGNGKAAIQQLNELWRQSERSFTWPHVPQTPEQAEYIRRWPKLKTSLRF